MAIRASESAASESKARAEASFRKDERARDGARAMLEYETNGRRVREQMAQLRALRLAKEAAERKRAADHKAVAAETVVTPAPVRPKKAK